MMNRLDRCKWLLLVLCLWIARRATAAEYWVSPNGDDANAGTQAAPWQTLGKAAAVVQTPRQGQSPKQAAGQAAGLSKMKTTSGLRGCQW